MEELDRVDACMKALGVSLNLLDPNGTFPEMLSDKVLTKIMQAALNDYRALSDAIHALRDVISETSTPTQERLTTIRWRPINGNEQTFTGSEELIQEILSHLYPLYAVGNLVYLHIEH